MTRESHRAARPLAERIDELLDRTLDDGQVSRGERSALGEVFESLTNAEVPLAQSRVFARLRSELARGGGEPAIAWCTAILDLLTSRTIARLARTGSARHEAWFSPDDACPRRIVQAIDAARQSIDVCVFTLTDDRIAAALRAARDRGVAVRLITDDDKSGDPGSDAEALARAGVLVRMDRTPAHMHHKFAVFDARLVLTGSYNWTRSADRDNRENFVVSDDPALVRRFHEHFARLWDEFGDGGS